MTTEIRKQQALPTSIRSFLSGTVRYATIATTNRDGSPTQNVIWYLVRDGDDGETIVVNSKRGRRWPTNLERDRRASLAVHDGEDAVTMRCELIEMYDDERAHADIVEMAGRYDPPERAAARIPRFRTEERVTFVLRPMSVNTHGSPG